MRLIDLWCRDYPWVPMGDCLAMSPCRTRIPVLLIGAPPAIGRMLGCMFQKGQSCCLPLFTIVKGTGHLLRKMLTVARSSKSSGSAHFFLSSLGIRDSLNLFMHCREVSKSKLKLECIHFLFRSSRVRSDTVLRLILIFRMVQGIIGRQIYG